MDLANFNPTSLGEAVTGVAVKGVGSILSSFPISIIGAITQMVIGLALPSDPRASCVVPVLTGKEIKSFKVDDKASDKYNTLLKLVTDYAKLHNKDTKKGDVVDAIKGVFSVCKELPIEDDSVLGRRNFIWGAFGTLGLNYFAEMLAADTADNKPSKFKNWIAGPGGKLLKTLAPAVAVCTAINPCTTDYLFAFLGVSVTVPVWGMPPATVNIKDAGITALGWSSGGHLVKSFTAWDPFELYPPFGDAPSFSPQKYTQNGNFLLQAKAEIELMVGLRMSDLVKSGKWAQKMPNLTLSLITETTGVYVWGSDARGWQILISGKSKPPRFEIMGLIKIPALIFPAIGPTGLIGYESTVFVSSREGPGGFYNVVIKYNAGVRLADILDNISILGPILKERMDSNDDKPVSATSGIEVSCANLRSHSACLFGITYIVPTHVQQNVAIISYRIAVCVRTSRMHKHALARIQVHVYAANGNGFGFAISAGVDVTDGMAGLVGKIPGLKGISKGVKVNLGITYIRDSKGQWTLTVTANSVTSTRSFRGQWILGCDDMEAKLLRLSCDD